MNSKLIISMALTSLMLCVFPAIGYSATAEDERPTREEVIEEVSQFTGLAKDSIELAFGDSPELLGTFDEAVTGIKIVNMFADAKDTEALVELANWMWIDEAIDKLKDKAFPASFNVFLSAVGVYSDTLEVIHNYYYVPKFDNSIYQTYKAQRMEDARRGDTSQESIETAFSLATGADSGYYAVKNKIFEDMVKAKNYNVDVMGEAVENKLWKEIDDFWKARLEAKLQQELTAGNRQQIKGQIWKSAEKSITALKARVNSMSGPNRLFFTGKNPPKGWRISQTAESLKSYKPAPLNNTKEITQRFKLYPAEYTEKVSQDGSSAQYFRGKDPISSGQRWLTVHILIGPSVQILNGGYRLDMKERLADMGQSGELGSLTKIIGELRDEGIELGYCGQEQYKGEWRMKYQCDFVKGDWSVSIVMWGNQLFMEADRQAIAAMANEIAAKITAPKSAKK